MEKGLKNHRPLLSPIVTQPTESPWAAAIHVSY